MKEKLRVPSTLRLIVAASLAAVSLAGCGNGAVQAGAAVTIGDERISTKELEQVVRRSLADPTAQQNVGTDRPAFERAVLRRLIDRELLSRVAAKEGVTVNRGQELAARERIAEQLGGEEGLNAEARKAGISDVDLQATVRDIAIRDALGDKLTASIPVSDARLRQTYQSNIGEYDRVRSAHILVASPALAGSILRQVRAEPGRFRELAAEHSTDPGSKDRGGDLGFQGRGKLDKAFERAIFTTRPGTFTSVRTQFGYHVISVQERRTVRFEQAKADLRRNLLAQERTQAVQQLLAETAKQVGIQVSPRFGTWDGEAMDVVPLPEGPGAVTTKSPRPDVAPPAEPGPVGP